MPKNKVPDHKFGIPPVCWYANYRTLTKGHYKDVTQAVEQGLALRVNGSCETFNVIAFFIVDLCHLKETVRNCQCTEMYGCYWCKKKLSTRDNSQPSSSPCQTIADREKWGKQAGKDLGDNPLKGSTAYTKFQQAHFGQTVSIINI